MRFKGLLATAVVLAVLAAPAMGLPVIDDQNSPTEMDLYEIYNALYGTSFESTSGFNSDAVDQTNSMEAAGLRVDPDELFQMLGSDAYLEFAARYAGNIQRFGYYTNPLEAVLAGDFTTTGVSGDYNWLFDVTGPTHQIITDPGVTPLSGFIPEADQPFGFYLNSNPGSSTVWYSQAARNVDGMDHMVAFWVPDPVLGTVLYDRFIIAFEDLDAYSAQYDQDFNDLVVEVYWQQPIPEPATISLLLLGLTAVVVRRRFGA